MVVRVKYLVKESSTYQTRQKVPIYFSSGISLLLRVCGACLGSVPFSVVFVSHQLPPLRELAHELQSLDRHPHRLQNT